MANIKVKVLYDHQIFSNQKYGGISKFFVNCIYQYCEHDLGITPIVGALFSINHHLLSLNSKKISLPHVRGISRVNRLLNRAYEYFINDFDIQHATYYFEKDLYTEKKLVVSIHDMIPELYSELLPKGNPHQAKYIYCQYADCLIAVSHNTKKDLINIYNLPEDKIKVVYHGIDVNFVRSELDAVSHIPINFFLYVGQRNGYKNFSILLQAFHKITKQNKELYLICAGPPMNSLEKEFIHNLELNDNIIFIQPTDRQLRWLYRKASAFVYPSLYEGFGIPILEALAQECPIVLADSSCFPEVAQDSAIYFSPHSESSLVNALEQALHDKEGNKHRADMGLKICKKLTWYKAASELAQIYKEIM